jgi:hypothetical protein
MTSEQPGLFDHDQEPQPVGEIINDGYEPSGLDEFAQVRPPFSDGK